MAGHLVLFLYLERKGTFFFSSFLLIERLMEKKRSAKRSKGDVSTYSEGDEIDIDEAHKERAIEDGKCN